MENGTTLYLTQSLTYASSFQIFSTGNSEGFGAIRMQANSVISGSVTLMANGSVGSHSGVNFGSITGVISDGGNGYALKEFGDGTITLSGVNTYSGGTQVSSNAQLNINNASAIGTGTLTIQSGATIDNTSGGAITLSTNNVQSWTGDFSFGGTNDLNLGTGTATLSASRIVTTAGTGVLTVGGVITDGASTFSLTETGTGTLAITGANTYGGGTFISGGKLSFGNNALSTGNLTFSTSGTLQWNGSNTQDISGKVQAIGSGVVATFDTNGNNVTLASVLSGAGGIAKSGTGTLTLTPTNTYTGGTTINAGTVSFKNGSLGTGNITFAANSTLQWNSTNTQDVSNKIQAIGSGIVGTFDTNGNNVTLASILSGAGGIAKVGTGALTLSAANTFTGGATLTAGTLNINNASAIGTGTFTINGGTIDNTSGGAIALSTNNAQTWASSFTFTGTNNLDLGTGAVALTANPTVTTTGGMLTVGGIISGAHSLTKAGAGALILSGANTYSTGTTLSAGTLNINNATALGTGTFAINGGTIDNTSGGAIALSNNNVQTWGGDFTFTGSNNLDLGTGAVTMSANRLVTLTAGNLTVGGNIGGGAVSLSVSGGGILVLGGTSTFSGGVSLNPTTPGSGNVEATSNGALGTGTVSIGTAGGVTTALLYLSGDITISNLITIMGRASSNLPAIENLLGNNTISSTVTLTNSANTNYEFFTLHGILTFSAANSINVSSSGLAGIWLKGTGGSGVISGTITQGTSTLGITQNPFNSVSWTFSGANTFSGGMTLTSGILNINNATALGTGTFAINGGTIDNTSGGSITLSNNNVQTWGGDFTFTGTNALNLGTGAVTLSANRQVTDSASTLTEGGIVSGAFSLTKAGAGTLVLTGANTYSGGTTINAGILSFASTSLGTGTITFGASSTLQWNGANTQDVSNKIQAIGSGVAATLDTNGNNVTFASVLSGAGSIVKAGTGALTLSAANTFTGGTTLSTGTLNINNATA